MTMPSEPSLSPSISSISAVTLWVKDMALSVGFYRSLGFELIHGGEAERFTSFRAGSGYLNLAVVDAAGKIPSWGRVIFYVEDVDAFHAAAVAAGRTPDFAPRDAAWGERYFHLGDPDGHALSFAKPLKSAD
jgi:catechol 2,3-dioxygenase-like lactoylglutathione lyase family enzyme